MLSHEGLGEGVTKILIEEPNRVLVVDDMPDRLGAMISDGVLVTKQITYAPNALRAICLLGEEKFDVVFLDHDLETYLGERELTGQDVARTLASLPPEFRPKHVVIHSMNFPGARAIEAILREAGIDHTRIPLTAFVNWSPLRADDSPGDCESIERYG